MRTLMAATVLAFAAPGLASGQTVVERILLAEAPCRGLKTDVEPGFGLPKVTLGIDRTREVSLETVDIRLAGERLEAEALGGLTCAASEGSMVRGDASVSVEIEAGVDLDDCGSAAVSVAARRFGGSFGEALRRAWAPLLRPRIEEAARDAVVEACEELAKRAAGG